MEQNDIVFGIDVSKDKSNVAVLDNRIAAKQFKITNNAKGFQSLGEKLASYTNPSIIFEATGVYSRRLENYLLQANYRYTILNPLRAKKDMDSFRRTKTDSLDAIGLAKVMSLHNYDPKALSNPVYSELHALERFYQQQNEDMVREKNRLHKSLTITFPEIEHLLSSTDGDLYWNLVEKFPSPKCALRYSVDTISKFVSKSTKKHMSIDRPKEIAGSLLELAKESFQMTNIDSEIEETRYHAKRVKEIDSKKNYLINEMAKLAKDLPEIKILTSIPGIAIKTAVCLTAELGDIRRFYSANAINAFVGIDLAHYESGNYTAKDHIRKRGNAYARKILFKTVLNIVAASQKHPTNISLVYETKKQSSSSGGTKKIVISAMNHLIRTIYYLVKNNEMYDVGKFSAKE